ncbi:MAG: glycoside hydrolase 15-related protein [Myxococcaceae bacterium]|nr:glycoside hydrolase 15-related protein [Myxococcaceae bacterium]
MRLEDLGLVGNCQFSALIDRKGSVVWCCLPRFDSEPVFSTLLDKAAGGQFRIGTPDVTTGKQRYLDNTNVLETTFESEDGSFRVLDFAPRFVQNNRTFRPTQLVRIVEPIRGTPRVSVLVDPKLGWSKDTPQRSQGSHHLRYDGFPSPVRLSTDIPLSYLEGQPFVLSERKHFVFSYGAAVEESLPALCARFLDETVRYWGLWVKDCDVPPQFQQEVIRSALVLKLHCYEDTGAIVAAMTTSIPESPGSGRTWDYRYCWLRDAYYALGAFRMLGRFEERESFVSYLLNIAASDPELGLNPLYRIDGSLDLEEQILEHWPGFNGEGPVRVGNGAAKHKQHDIFGEMVLALTPVFLDDRFKAERSADALGLLERLTRRAIAVAGTPDAGIWEYRTAWEPQTFSSLMSWAAADRMAKVAARHLPGKEREFREAATAISEQVIARSWNAELGAFAGTYGGQNLDASLLELATLRMFSPEDPRLRSTVDAIWKGLGHEGWLFRYRLDDGFGRPTVAFVICTFWLVEALAVIGRRKEASEVLAHIHAAMSPLGLMSEDIETANRRMWGNFPQAYSHVGLIRAAFAASPGWEEIL